MIPWTPSENALTIYKARYLDEDARTVESLHRRVSGGHQDYFDLMNQGLFLPNSPTLFNAGKKQGGTLSACFVFDIQDALLGDWPDGGCDQPFATSIAGTAFKAMAVAKAGGGVGYYLGNIRRKGSEVKSTHKRACGPVIVLRWLNTLNWLITQGGKRALAQMGILDAHHPDILEFIHCKDENPHELSSFNISVSWRNKMLKEIDFERLFHDGNTFNTTNGAGMLWGEQCLSAWKTGDPGMYFWDTTNAFNATPHLGDINATNPCGETPNLNDEPCNLGSLTLSRFFKKVGTRWVFEWDRYKEAVRTAIRFMDDILDWNVFPHPDIFKRARETRKLGLGVMGYADSLALQHIPYDSRDAVDWGSEVAYVNKCVSFEESIALGTRKGAYPAYETASDETKKRFVMCRNSTRTSIAPTGTIALLADASSSIEPHYSLEWERTTGEGIKLKERIPVADMIGDFVPKTAMQIPYQWHIKHQAAWQKHTDLGVSKTINLPNTATVKDISDAYRMMWESGCKGGTVFRDGCRSEQVLRETKTAPKQLYLGVETPEPVEKISQEEIREQMEKYMTGLHRTIAIPKLTLPKERHGTTIEFSISGTRGFLTPNVYPDGTLAEIFIELANDGATLAGLVKAFAKTFSVSLQNGTPLAKLVKLHKNCVYEPRGMTGDPEVPTCTSITDYIVQKLEKRFLSGPPKVNSDEFLKSMPLPIPGTGLASGLGLTGQLCPDCGEQLIREASCMKCVKPGCGYSKC